MRRIKTLYRGIDTLSYSAVMPTEVYNFILEGNKDEQRGPFRFFHHSPAGGYTIRAGHISDHSKKVSEQGGYSAFVNIHALACYNREFSQVGQSFQLKNCSINRIDFAVDMQNSVPSYRNVKVTRQSKPMVVPCESITYGWGTKYKALSAIFYNKLKDIAEHNGEKDYMLPHYDGRDKRTGVTRFEIRVMKEMIKRTNRIFEPVEADFSSKGLGSLIKKALKRVKVTDPKYPDFTNHISGEIDKYFCVDIRQEIPRAKSEYDTTMLAKQMIGIAAAIVEKSPRFREVAENMEKWEFIPHLMRGIFEEYLNMPFALTKCEELFVRIHEEKQKGEILP